MNLMRAWVHWRFRRQMQKRTNEPLVAVVVERLRAAGFETEVWK